MQARKGVADNGNGRAGDEANGNGKAPGEEAKKPASKGKKLFDFVGARRS